MKNLIVLLCSLVLFCSCLPHAPTVTDEYKNSYVGQWRLIKTTLADSVIADSSDIIHMHSNRTFSCSYDLFNYDSSSTSGTWDIFYEFEYYSAGYLCLILEIGESSRWFKISKERENDIDIMRWDKSEWATDELKYKWEYVDEE